MQHVKVEDHSQEFLRELDKVSATAMRKAMKEAVADAKDKAPERSGRLKKSIKSKVVIAPDKITGEFGAGDFKAPWYEFGTENQKARPFITPASDNLERSWPEIFASYYTKLIKRLGKKGIK